MRIIKNIKISILVVIGFLLLTYGNSQAVLYDRGGGLIYDNDSNLTWLQDANLAATNSFGISGINSNGSMDWPTAIRWIDAMNSSNYLGYNNWRLPTTDLFSIGNAGPEKNGYIFNCTGIELGHLFFIELGNLAYYSPSDNFQSGYGLVNVGPFIHLQSKSYWSSTEWQAAPTEVAYRFDFAEGGLDETWKGFSFPHTWAVRDGDVAAPVPEPSTLLLLSGGVAGIAFWRRKNNRKNNRQTA